MPPLRTRQVTTPRSAPETATAWSNGLMQRLLHGLHTSLATPSRNPRMAVVLGRLLGAAFLITFFTGLYSHFMQDPLPWMHFPTRPIFLYQVSQGVHITAGILCFPLILGKLYVVYPELFKTPPVRSFWHLVERASIALFVAASMVEITIGLLNTFQFYSLFPFPFRQVHFALSFVVVGSLAIHIAVKLSTITKYWKRSDSYDADGNLIDHDLTADAAQTADATQPGDQQTQPGDQQTDGEREPETADATRNVSAGGLTGRVFAWVDKTPTLEPRASRRGFIATIAAAAAVIVVTTAGQSFRIFDSTNIFGPRKNGVGPNDLPVNRTARAAGVLETATSDDWRLDIRNGNRTETLSRADLEAMPQYEVVLPISCVEGWSQYATWRGPRMRDLADRVGAGGDVYFRATSLEQDSIYAVMEMGPEFVRDELTLVALQVNGATLDIDHGFPARMIAPSRPGVLQTKWLRSLEVI